MKEAIKERIGSDIGTVVVKCTVTDKGLMTEIGGQPNEVLHLTAELIDDLAVRHNIQHEAIFYMLIDVLFAENV